MQNSPITSTPDATQRYSLTLANDVRQVSRLNDFVEQSARQMGIAPDVVMSLRLAIEEAVVNAMTYAYPPDTPGTVSVELSLSGSLFQCIISDSGAPFDPTGVADADITLSAEERPIGGLGIFLVRQLMDGVAYERSSGNNVLKLSKNI